MTDQEFNDAMDQLHEEYLAAPAEERRAIIESAAQLAFDYDTQISSEQLEMVDNTDIPPGNESGWNRLTGGPYSG